MAAPFLFFASLREHSKSVLYKVRTDAALQDALSLEFQSQANRVLKNANHAIAYRPGEQCDEEEVFVIPDYQAPEGIVSAISRHDTLPILKQKEVSGTIRSLFAIAANGTVMLQRFTARQKLTGKFQITLSKNTFRQQRDAGLLLGDKLAAVVTKKGLYFKTFEQAKAVLPNLATYFTEATNPQLVTFTQHDSLHFEDDALFVHGASIWLRRKVAIIASEGILDRFTVKQIRSVAKTYGLNFDVRKNPKTKSTQLVVPSDKAIQKSIIKLLSNEFLYSELTAERFAVAAKRKL